MTSEKPVIRVVDDDQGFRTAICRVLRAEGYEVREYPSAGALLLDDQNDAPGCVLLDLRMPGPSGLDLQASLAKREQSLPIIFLTASREELRSLRARYDTLSPREREVLHHVAAGRLNKQIASAIGAAERTVKAHRARVMAKMEAGSVAELVRAVDRLAAAQVGALEPPASPASRQTAVS
jgi:FixJ family two-component response regulator